MSAALTYENQQSTLRIISTVAAGFAALPEVHFTTKDTTQVDKAIRTIYEKLADTTLAEGDPVRIFLTTLAAVIAQRNIILDQTGRLNLLRYATGPFLDHIGAMLDCARLGEAPAEAVERFHLLRPVNYQVVIPLGSRVTADSQLHFATTEFAIIEPGQTYVDVPIAAMTPGAAGNGLVPGQINKAVDLVDGIVQVENITRTSAGADVEDDEDYRVRIQMAPEKFTCAGSEESYIYFAKSAHSAVGDVSVYSPTPGVVEIYILIKGGLSPEPDGPEIRAVTEALSGRKVRPLTDQVFVLPAKPVVLDYQFRYFLNIAQAGLVDSIHSSLVTADRDYRTWQAGILGRDINPDHLVKLARVAGAKRIEPEVVERDENGVVTSAAPMEFRTLEKNEIAQIPEGLTRVIFGGLEDE